MQNAYSSGLTRGRVVALLVLTTLWAACSNETDDPSETTTASAKEQVDWHDDIAPIVQEKCVHCHQTGGIAPFSMQDYATAKTWAGAMADAVAQGRMPPFLAQETDACQPRLPWAQDLRLSAAQKAKFRAWAKAGAPAGRAQRRLSAPSVAALPREDVVMRLPEPIEVSGNRDIHTCVVVDPEVTKDSYVSGRMITVGNAKVLHHVVSYVIEPGTLPDGTPRNKAQLEAAVREARGVGIGGRYDCFGGSNLPGLTTTMLNGWAPGSLPNLAPPGTAQFVRKDALVLLDIHYHPTGETEVDSDTGLSLMLADERPNRVSQMVLLGNAREERKEYASGVSELLKQPGEAQAEFVIPAGASKHIEDMRWTWKLPEADYRIYAAATHMHYVGRDMRVELEHVNDVSGDGSECLIETPHWDFNWQRGYAYDAEYDALPKLRNGDRLHFHCEYDNTMQNPFVAKALHERGMDAPVEVQLGEDTLDEMCVGAVGLIFPNSN
ncbi:MAG TPA: hypothetical protein VJR89_21180 [Polyangiales bacterium]|nr:hypothetical protein [Polyangiales bacterium]